MQNKFLNGLVYEICEIYIYDVLIHGKSEESSVFALRMSLSTLRKPSLVSRRSNTSVTSSPRWKLYLQDKDFYLCHVPGKELHLSRLYEKHMLSNKSEKPTQSGIKPSWPLLSRNIAYPMQFLNKADAVDDNTGKVGNKK